MTTILLSLLMTISTIFPNSFDSLHSEMGRWMDYANNSVDQIVTDYQCKQAAKKFDAEQSVEGK